MKRRMVPALLVAALLAGACNSELGLDDPECTLKVLNTHVLAAQAVPTAKYTPCINELRLGWDGIEWYARSGESGIKFFHSFSNFLNVTVTESCDVSAATPVASGLEDIARFEAVDSQPAEIFITIVPSEERPLDKARDLVDDLSPLDLDDRPVRFIIDEDFEESMRSRVNRALRADHYVWIVSTLDAEESKVEMRSNVPAISGTGMDPGDALELIESFLPELYYRGNWFFTFDGGCITYDFNADGIVAVTVADDADEALGFYPAFQLRQFARDSGFDIE